MLDNFASNRWMAVDVSTKLIVRCSYLKANSPSEKCKSLILAAKAIVLCMQNVSNTFLRNWSDHHSRRLLLWLTLTGGCVAPPGSILTLAGVGPRHGEARKALVDHCGAVPRVTRPSTDEAVVYGLRYTAVDLCTHRTIAKGSQTLMEIIHRYTDVYLCVHIGSSKWHFRQRWELYTCTLLYISVYTLDHYNGILDTDGNHTQVHCCISLCTHWTITTIPETLMESYIYDAKRKAKEL